MNALLLCALPAVLILFNVASRYRPSLAAPILLGSSLLFYSVADLRGLPLLLISIGFNYFLGGRLSRSDSYSRGWLTAGIVGNLLPLIFYKYIHHGPAGGEAAGLAVLGNIPLGLSFYSFQQISCLVDIRKHGVPRLSLWRHALFSSFFAQIPAGPISHYRRLAPQILVAGRTPVSARVLSAGISLFVMGLAKKLLLADKLATTVDASYRGLSAGAGLSLPGAWLAAWTFLLQLYFDFSGYSDMALGVALCCGISLPPNFNSPLKALSSSEFVDRWHMSLVSWIREYLYHPLFDFVRKLPLGSSARRRVLAWAIATVASMAAIGAWHGSQIGFLIGGTVAGILLVLRQLASTAWPSRRARQSGWVRRGRLRISLLATLSMLAIPMRARTSSLGVAMLRAMFDWRTLLPGELLHHTGVLPIDLHEPLSTLVHGRLFLAVPLIATWIAFCLPNTMQVFGILPKSSSPLTADSGNGIVWRPTRAWGMAVGCLMVLEFLSFQISQQTGFIYAQF